MSTVLITGASSYLAHRLVPLAAQRADVVGVACNSPQVPKPARLVHVDISDEDAVDRLFNEIKPDAVIHTAAVNPGGSDEAMSRVNHSGSAHVAKASAQMNCRLVAVSSDVVHSGTNAPYADDSDPDPVNVYGCTKALGEQAILAICPTAIIARTSLIYGLDSMDRGTEGFVNRLRDGQPLALFNNVLRQPVWIESLSAALCQLAFNLTDESGFINLVGDQVLSRAEFGVKMLRYWGIHDHDLISIVSADDIQGLPLDLRMSTARAARLALHLPGVDAVLAAKSEQSDF